LLKFKIKFVKRLQAQMAIAQSASANILEKKSASPSADLFAERERKR
jgi:hypothetical protein